MNGDNKTKKAPPTWDELTKNKQVSNGKKKPPTWDELKKKEPSEVVSGEPVQGGSETLPVVSAEKIGEETGKPILPVEELALPVSKPFGTDLTKERKLPEEKFEGFKWGEYEIIHPQLNTKRFYEQPIEDQEKFWAAEKQLSEQARLNTKADKAELARQKIKETPLESIFIPDIKIDIKNADYETKEQAIAAHKNKGWQEAAKQMKTLDDKKYIGKTPEEKNKEISVDAIIYGQKFLTPEEKQLAVLNQKKREEMAKEFPDAVKIAELTNQMMKTQQQRFFFDPILGVQFDKPKNDKQQLYVDNFAKAEKEFKGTDEDKLGQLYIEKYYEMQYLEKQLREVVAPEYASYTEAMKAVPEGAFFAPSKTARRIEDTYYEKAGEFAALSKIYLSNVDPTDVHKNLRYHLNEFGNAFVGGVLPDRMARELTNGSERAMLDNMNKLSAEGIVNLSDNQKKSMKRTFTETLTELGGGFAGIALPLGALGKVVKGVEYATGLANVMEKWSKSGRMIDKLWRWGVEAGVEEGKLQVMGFKPGAGVGFATARYLPIPVMKGSLKKIQPILNAISQGGIGGTAGMELAGLTEAAVKDIAGDEDFGRFIKQQFGEDSEWLKRVGAEVIVNSFLPLALSPVEIKRMGDEAKTIKNAETKRKVEQLLKEADAIYKKPPEPPAEGGGVTPQPKPVSPPRYTIDGVEVSREDLINSVQENAGKESTPKYGIENDKGTQAEVDAIIEQGKPELVGPKPAEPEKVSEEKPEQPILEQPKQKGEENVKENEVGLPSGEPQGKVPEQEKPVEKGSAEKTEASRVVQAPPEEKVIPHELLVYISSAIDGSVTGINKKFTGERNVLAKIVGIGHEISTKNNRIGIAVKEGKTAIYLSRIAVERKGTGEGRRIIEALKSYANINGKTIFAEQVSNEVFFKKNGFLKEGQDWIYKPKQEEVVPPVPEKTETVSEKAEEVLYTTKKGKYNVVKRGEYATVVSADGTELPKGSEKIASRVMTEYRKQYKNNQGKTSTEVISELPEEDQAGLGENISDADIVLRYSENPQEVLIELGKANRYLAEEEIDPKDRAIATHMGRITQKSWNMFADRHWTTKSIAKAYFSKDGHGIDQIAQDASYEFDPSGTNETVTPEDVVNFIRRYPNGGHTAFEQKNDVFYSLANKYAKLSGFYPSNQQIKDAKNIDTRLDKYANEVIHELGDAAEDFYKWVKEYDPFAKDPMDALEFNKGKFTKEQYEKIKGVLENENKRTEELRDELERTTQEEVEKYDAETAEGEPEEVVKPTEAKPVKATSAQAVPGEAKPVEPVKTEVVKTKVVKTKAEQLAEKKATSDTKISEGLDGIMTKLGGIKKLSADEKTSVYEDIKKIAEGVFEKFGYKGKELIDQIKKFLTEKGFTNLSIIDDWAKEELPKTGFVETKDEIYERARKYKLAERLLDAPDNIVPEELKKRYEERGAYYKPQSMEESEKAGVGILNSFDLSTIDGVHEAIGSLTNLNDNSLDVKTKGVVGKVKEFFQTRADEVRNLALAHLYKRITKQYNESEGIEKQQLEDAATDLYDFMSRYWNKQGRSVKSIDRANTIMGVENNELLHRATVKKVFRDMNLTAREGLGVTEEYIERTLKPALEGELQYLKDIETKAEELIERLLTPSELAQRREQCNKIADELWANYQKSKKEFTFALPIPPMMIDFAVKTVVQSIRAFPDVEFAVKKGLEYIKTKYKEFYESLNEEEWKRFVKSFDKYAREKLQANQDEIDKRIEIPEKKKGKGRGVVVPQPPTKEQKEGDTASEKLAKKILSKVKEKGLKKATNPQKELINTLLGKVTEKLDKEKKPKANVEEKILLAINNREEYAKVWEESKDIVTQKINDNGKLSDQQKVDAINKLEAYYQEIIGRPYSDRQLDRLVRDEIKSLGIKPRDIYDNNNYEDVKKSIAESIITRLRLTEDKAKELSENVLGKVDELILPVLDKLKGKETERLQREYDRVVERLAAKVDKLTPNQLKKILYQGYKDFSETGKLDDERLNDFLDKAMGLESFNEKRPYIDELFKKIYAISPKLKAYALNATDENWKAYKKATYEAVVAKHLLDKIFAYDKAFSDIFTAQMKGGLLGIPSQVTNFVGYAGRMPFEFSADLFSGSLDSILQMTGNALAMNENLAKKKWIQKWLQDKRTAEFVAKETGLRSFLWGRLQSYKYLPTAFKKALYAVRYGQTDQEKYEIRKQLDTNKAAKELYKYFKKGFKGIKPMQAVNAAQEFAFGVGYVPQTMLRLLALADMPKRLTKQRDVLTNIAHYNDIRGTERKVFLEDPIEWAKIYKEDNIDAMTFAENAKEIAAKAGRRASYAQDFAVLTKLVNLIKARLPEGETKQEKMTYNFIRGLSDILKTIVVTFETIGIALGVEANRLALPEMMLGKAIIDIRHGNRNKALKSLGYVAAGYMMRGGMMYLISNGYVMQPLQDKKDQKEKDIANSPGAKAPGRLNWSRLRRLLTGHVTDERIDDTWIDYRYLGSFGLVMGALSQISMDDGYLTDVPKPIREGVALTNAVFRNSFMSGANAFLDALGGGEYERENMLATAAGVAISPYLPRITEDISKYLDKENRLLRSRGADMKENLSILINKRLLSPGKLAGRRNIWGDKVQYVPKESNRLVYTIISPFKSSTRKINAVEDARWQYRLYDEWTRLNKEGYDPKEANRLYASLPDKNINMGDGIEIELTAPLQDKFEEQVGIARKLEMRGLMPKIMDNPISFTENLAKTVEAIEKCYSNGYATGKELFIQQNATELDKLWKKELEKRPRKKKRIGKAKGETEKRLEEE